MEPGTGDNTAPVPRPLDPAEAADIFDNVVEFDLQRIRLQLDRDKQRTSSTTAAAAQAAAEADHEEPQLKRSRPWITPKRAEKARK